MDSDFAIYVVMIAKSNNYTKHQYSATISNIFSAGH